MDATQRPGLELLLGAAVDRGTEAVGHVRDMVVFKRVAWPTGKSSSSPTLISTSSTGLTTLPSTGTAMATISGVFLRPAPADANRQTRRTREPGSRRRSRDGTLCRRIDGGRKYPSPRGRSRPSSRGRSNRPGRSRRACSPADLRSGDRLMKHSRPHLLQPMRVTVLRIRSGNAKRGRYPHCPKVS